MTWVAALPTLCPRQLAEVKNKHMHTHTHSLISHVSISWHILEFDGNIVPLAGRLDNCGSKCVCTLQA